MLKTVFSIFLAGSLMAQVIPDDHLTGLNWRCIGPHRASRTVGAVGVAQQPNVFYIGVNNGGVWKSNDYGRTWVPIFDDQPTGSIGDVAVAPSNPNVIYVGSGEGLHRPDLAVGDGIYKSTDGGKTWLNTGIRDGQQIGGLSVDPNDENRVFAAVLGHPYGPNTERGVYRTLDGGRTWVRVFYIDENTGAIQVTIDPSNPQVVFANLWEHREGPWENASWQGTNSGLFKSTDGGKTWKKMTKGLPTPAQGLGRIGFDISRTNPKRLYATVQADKPYGGIYRSDDGGESWTMLNDDQRLWSRGNDFGEIKIHPANPDIVFVANVATWKSTDGGKTWLDFRGAPGGDDYHRIWINPTNPDIMILAADQGAIVSVNGGETFSSWYNQPTAQFYHVSTDNEFPYNVYGGQQESGSVMISSRSNHGRITYREWQPVGAEEYGYIAADPLNPDLVYGGKLTRFNKKTGQTQNVEPEPRGQYAPLRGKYRYLRSMPVIFSPADPRILFYAGNVLFKTTTGGASWDVISPDLSRSSFDVPSSIGKFASDTMKTMPRRGVIYTIAPSPLDANIIWAGTDDGLIHLTTDGGKSWKNVTPPELTSWSKVSIIDAGHFDKQTAFAAVNRFRCDDLKPYIYKTMDGGKTWSAIVAGLPNDPINVVREDPQTKGLLFAGSERHVSVSFDDGQNWQSLRLNMPATSIRDLVIKDDDLVIGTHGRSFWILDNITPLRQRKDMGKTQLFKPQKAVRVRWNMYSDTPLPPEEPGGENPPDGAMIDFYLDEDVSGELRLEILDGQKQVIRSYSNLNKDPEIPPVNFPRYWIRPSERLSRVKGAHRFLWDMHYTPLDVAPGYPISAVYMNTPAESTSPWVLPGEYTVRLTVNGKSYEQKITVVMDPRVTTSSADLQRQFDLSMRCYEIRKLALRRIRQLAEWKSRSASRMSVAGTKIQSELKKFNQSLDNLNSQLEGIKGLDYSAATVFSVLEEADMAPTLQAQQEVERLVMVEKSVSEAWSRLLEKELPALNKTLKGAGLESISVE